MTADSLWMLWRQTYDESSEDKGNNSRVFLSEGYLPYIICDGRRALWLENWKYKLDVRSHLSERGSYSGLILLGLPGGLLLLFQMSTSAQVSGLLRHNYLAVMIIYEMEDSILQERETLH